MTRYHFDGHFPDPISGVFLVDDRFLLTAPFTFFRWGHEPIVVPEEFITDFNSVPRSVWSWFSPWDHKEAGIVHDYLYWTGALPRQEADAIHRLILELKGVRQSKRHIIYSILRLAGWRAWNRYRAAQTANADRL